MDADEDLLDVARAVIEAGPVCDACLGRTVADRSHGLRNDERGRALRVAVALADDEPFEPTATDDCWVCEGLTGDYDAWAERAVDALDGHDFETYQVGCRLPPLYAENDRLLREDAGLDPEAGETLSSEFNREVGRRVGQATGAEVDFERPDVLALCNVARGDVDAQVNPAFVYGRYRKLERDVPQTEWPCRECGGSGVQLGDDGEEPCGHCDGVGYMYETSVEEEIAPHVRAAMDGADATFHGAGREDVDARMLGPGRPFVVEVAEPRVRSPDVDAIETAVNEASDLVEVTDLALATYEMVERVKELDAQKTYRAAVAFEESVATDDLDAAVETLDGATVAQETPERVDHRRASKTRTRTAYEVTVEREDDRHATLEIVGEGGLYVKELVSGDGGRTEPSLAGELGVGATVEALDVLDVTGEDEAFADPEYLREAERSEASD